MWLGRAYKAGSRVTNDKLAKTLTRVANEGPKALYEGAIAAELSKTAGSAGGALSPRDLLAYAPKWRAPLRKTWAGYEVVTMPPPSAGGMMLVQTLGLYSRGELRQAGFNTPAYQHLLAEAFRSSFADRVRFVGDPDYQNVPLARLVSDTWLGERRKLIAPNRTKKITEFAIEEHGTHHLTAADADGNAVALTTTVNRAFGSKLMAPQSGIVLNDELDDFTSNSMMNAFGMTQSPNRARPNARPVSSMTPTLVLKDNEVVLTAGGSGGLTIATNTSQAVLARLAFDMDPKAILDAPRFQLGLDDTTMLVPKNTAKSHIENLQQRGEVVGEVRFTSTAVQLISAAGGRKSAASDPRKFGVAMVGDGGQQGAPR
jgi:gamma-glutamyltranspeptidase/glutathione hydrolase